MLVDHNKFVDYNKFVAQKFHFGCSHLKKKVIHYLINKKKFVVLYIE